MFHRHPFLSLTTFAYLGFVGWVTLTPISSAPTSSDFIERVLARLQRHDDLSWLTYDRAEFLANIALFVPVGLFLLLLVGTRFWWVAGLGAFVLTSVIENVQRSIPGRVPDERDVLANTAGALLGILIGLVLTFPATRRRARARRTTRATAARQPSGV
ncbi:MAG: VanZ family protein [Nocardioides sp.]|uniref:VanZ family protein n=1 Tax=Nocardioides sp. TaxID=35761 RepID=UPI000C9644D2|nr:VanZ family protein [Nocardioides sp.]MAS54502.1 VanZ family protein [Pimelobacter sp.]MDE0778407.1 VanZ family protein [Nocardioides sp.]